MCYAWRGHWGQVFALEIELIDHASVHHFLVQTLCWVPGIVKVNVVDSLSQGGSQSSVGWGWKGEE